MKDMKNFRAVNVTETTETEGVTVDLSQYTKDESDSVRMALLLAYGHRQLELASDGSCVVVRLLSRHPSIVVQ